MYTCCSLTVRFYQPGNFFKVIKRCIKWKSMESYHPSDFRLIQMLAHFHFRIPCAVLVWAMFWMWLYYLCVCVCAQCAFPHCKVFNVHVCCSFYYCLHFIHEWRKEIAFPFRMHIYFFYRHLSIPLFTHICFILTRNLFRLLSFVYVSTIAYVLKFQIYSQANRKRISARHFDFFFACHRK